MTNQREFEALDGPPNEPTSDETLKSNLLLEAQLLRARGETDEAANRFAQAVEIEERLSAACLANDKQTSAWIHQFSAVGSWAQAGNFHLAILLGQRLLTSPDLPAPLRQRIEAYTQQLQKRRVEWSVGLVFSEAGAG